MKDLMALLIKATFYFILFTFWSNTSVTYGQAGFKRWSIQPSLIHVDLSAASTSIKIGGSDLAGKRNMSFSNSTTFGIVIDFYLTKSISLNSVIAIPPSTGVRGENSLAGAKAGTLRYGSWPLALVYHFDLKQLQPFVGVGINYTMIFKVEEQDFKNVEIDPKPGPVIRGGFDYMITERFGVGVSVQKFYAKANITGLAPASPGVNTSAVVEGNLNPWIWTFAGVIRF